jgi:translation initiation factor 2B subunit (eIF-2B alpha/beta/delta family)
MNAIDHPDHYGGKENTYEAIKIIEAYNLNFSLGNVIKYVLRAGKKNSDTVEDLKKARWYIERQIENLEKK